MSIISQINYLVTEQSDGTKLNEDVGDISKLTIHTTFTCGDRLLYGNDVYPTVQIGSQCWMAKNLNVGKRIDGNSNQTSTDTDIEKYCYQNNESNCDIYGGLYQWEEAMNYSTSEGTKGICPSGWHIPSKTEFEACTTAVSGNNTALKAKGQGIGDGYGTNTSGFSFMLAGYVSNSAFTNIVQIGTIWSSSFESEGGAWSLVMFDYSDNMGIRIEINLHGYTVRCLRD